MTALCSQSRSRRCAASSSGSSRATASTCSRSRAPRACRTPRSPTSSCSATRRRSSWCRVPDCPVIVLGGADPEARVRALERCDDYLSRPFVYEELVARIRALLRRCPPRSELVDLGELVVDRAARRVLVARPRRRALAEGVRAAREARVRSRSRLHARASAARRVGLSGLRADAHGRVARVARALQARGRGLEGWVVNAWGVGYKLRPSV